MNNFKISYKQKTKFIEKIQKEDYIQTLKQQGFIKSIFSSKEYPDIYFHSGALDDEAMNTDTNSKVGAGMIVDSVEGFAKLKEEKRDYSQAEIELNAFIRKNYPEWNCEAI